MHLLMPELLALEGASKGPFLNLIPKELFKIGCNILEDLLNIQLCPFAYVRVQNKTYEDEVTFRGKNIPLKCF